MIYYAYRSNKSYKNFKGTYFFICSVIILLFGCANKIDKPFISAKESKDLIMMKGFNLVQTIGGIKRLEVNAEEAQIYLKEKIMKFYDVKVKYFDKGKEISNLKSNEGVIYTDINEMELLGKVEIIAESNTKLETKKLRWIERDNKLFTDDFVKITRGDNVMMGYGMESDLNLENIVIKEVKTKITDLESIEEKGGSK